MTSQIFWKTELNYLTYPNHMGEKSYFPWGQGREEIYFTLQSKAKPYFALAFHFCRCLWCSWSLSRELPMDKQLRGFCMRKQNWSNGQCLRVLGPALKYRFFITFPSPEPCSEDAPHPHSTAAAGAYISSIKSLGAAALTALVTHNLSNLHSRRPSSKRGHWHCRHEGGSSLAMRQQALNPGTYLEGKQRYAKSGRKQVYYLLQSPNSCYSIRRMHPLMFHWTVIGAPRKTLKKHSIYRQAC